MLCLPNLKYKEKINVNYATIKQIIDRYDIMNLLSIGAPSDEYDIESKMIAEQIASDMAVQEIANIVKNIFDSQFSENIDISLCMDVAKEIRFEG